jgi:hypothetical protein
MGEGFACLIAGECRNVGVVKLCRSAAEFGVDCFSMSWLHNSALFSEQY